MRRRLLTLAVFVTLHTMLVAACHAGSPGSNEPSNGPLQPTSEGTRSSVHGPSFPECGGVSDETVIRLTRVPGLVATARNPMGCQWLVGGSIDGPWFSFSWYRGSPIGRERKNEDLTRTRVHDITVDGHEGFVAASNGPRVGDRLCDVAIQYQDDFFEWSIRYVREPFPDPCDIAIELSRRSIAAAR